MSAVLIAGAAGFIGANFARWLARRRPDLPLVAVDSLSGHSAFASVKGLVEGGKMAFHRADIADLDAMTAIYRQHGVERVINFAAESHNDRAILDPTAFVRSNALGAQALLEVSRQRGVARHVHVSSIEVYGEQPPGTPAFHEGSPLNAKTPYAASKAAGDLMVRAYMHTYPRMDICLTHCANNYGPWQFPEKLLPLCATHALRGKKIPLYGDGMQERDWLHVDDHCAALETLLLHPGRFSAQPGAAYDAARLPIYDISARCVATNRRIVGLVLDALGLPFEERVEFVADRPNHDRRYQLDPGRIERELGFKARVSLEEGVERAVRWYVDNEAWWRPILEGQPHLEIRWGEQAVPGINC